MKKERLTASSAAFASTQRPVPGADEAGRASDPPPMAAPETPRSEPPPEASPESLAESPADSPPGSSADSHPKPSRRPRRTSSHEAPRDLSLALRRGWRQTCPACGGGPMFDRYLSVRERCVSCGERLDGHTADDAPAWLTIVVVGHIVVPLMLLVWRTWSPPLWVHWTLWPTLTLLLSLALLPRLKAMVVGLQWANRMAGFGNAKDRD